MLLPSLQPSKNSLSLGLQRLFTALSPRYWVHTGAAGSALSPGAGTELGSPGSALTPLGLPGALCITGLGVARGYVGDAARTAERFFVTGAGASSREAHRGYWTGDVVRVTVEDPWNELKDEEVGRSGCV